MNRASEGYWTQSGVPYVIVALGSEKLKREEMIFEGIMVKNFQIWWKTLIYTSKTTQQTPDCVRNQKGRAGCSGITYTKYQEKRDIHQQFFMHQNHPLENKNRTLH